LEDTTIKDVLKTVEGLYAQKNYQSALKLLETNQAQISSGIWHYNMGTVLGKLENYPLARYHLLMANEEGFNSKEVLLNKKLIESKLDISKFEKPYTVTDYLVKGSLEASQGILTSLSLILVIVGIINLWKKSSYKIGSVLILSAVMVLGLNWWIQSWNKVIVLTTQSVQEGPSAIFPSREEVPAGVMIITRSNGDWLKIVYPSRLQGWIKNSGLKELK
jgi:hypothetical protein